MECLLARKLLSMQALTRRRFCYLHPKLPCEDDTLCIVCEEKCLALLYEKPQLRHPRLKINGTTELTKLCRPRKLALAGKSKSADYGERRKSCHDPTDVRIVTFSIAKGLFPDFFPHEEIKDYHQQECFFPLKYQADPVFNAWMKLFGHQIIK